MLCSSAACVSVKQIEGSAVLVPQLNRLHGVEHVMPYHMLKLCRAEQYRPGFCALDISHAACCILHSHGLQYPVAMRLPVPHMLPRHLLCRKRV